MKVDVDAIHQQERGLASERRWYARLGALLWGSLVIQTYVGSRTLARFCCEFLNLQRLAESAFSKFEHANEAQMRHALPPHPVRGSRAPIGPLGPRCKVLSGLPPAVGRREWRTSVAAQEERQSLPP